MYMNHASEWSQLPGRICHRSLGFAYRQRFHRFLVYLLGGLLIGVWTFIALGLYENYRWYLIPIGFKGIYSWHTMMNFGLCIVVFDEMIARLAGQWGRFDQRTIGKQFLIWTVSFLVGFVIQRTLVFDGIMYYALDLYHYYETFPEMRPRATRHFLFCVPFFLITMGALAGISYLRQRGMEKEQRDRVVLEEELACKEAMIQQTRNSLGRENTSLPIQVVSGNNSLFLESDSVSHITVEDHYCRIYRVDEGTLKNDFIKSSLAELLDKLPEDDFIQIHRSHVVNVQAVHYLETKSRVFRAHLKSGIVLPVSRHRLSEVKQQFQKGAELSTH